MEQNYFSEQCQRAIHTLCTALKKKNQKKKVLFAIYIGNLIK